MALKRNVTKKPVTPKEEDRVLEIMSRITDIDSERYNLSLEKTELQKELLEIKIKPFKIGDYCMAEVQAGKFRKVRKCLIENERGILYLRPVNNNGELSGRHFSLTPIPGKSYSDYLKSVEE
jgi:hypothetical protein